MEIAFLAISSMEQVKGFGTRLMNKLKSHCQGLNIQYFLTYADNNAIGYFRKQGFNTALKLGVDKWKGIIKDYDGGTLMEAECNPNIDYDNLSEILNKQHIGLKNITKKFLRAQNKITYAQFDKALKKNGVTDEEMKEAEEGKISQKIFDSIPGMKASGWTYNDYLKNLDLTQVPKKNFLYQCREILLKAKNHINYGVFAEPVDVKLFKDYTEKIKHPMDLRTLERNLESGNYKKAKEFIHDWNLIFENCMNYNVANKGTAHSYYKAAENFQKDFKADIDKLTDDRKI
ncbi:MAG: GNAT family N-acetyltransferase [archaeon]|nr:GNAT family N-acetyltransferase [archaeon]